MASCGWRDRAIRWPGTMDGVAVPQTALALRTREGHLLQDLFRLDGKVIVVTGASSGLGERFARVLTEAGATCVLASRRVDRLTALADQLERATAVSCDVTHESECSALIEHTVDLHGRIDVLVNAAGVSEPMKAQDETTEHFRWTVDVNLIGPFTLSRLAGGHMIGAGRGAIINIASIAGIVGVGRMPQASYAASKGGLVNLTRELAAQWARRGVRVNAIAPGFFPTEMTQELFATDRGTEWVGKLTPMGRPGEVHELDGALLYLASDASSYVTGTVLVVDGGWTAV